MHEWVEPAIFVEHNGIQIYNTYRNDDVQDLISNYFYTTNKYETDYKDPYHSDFMIDVRYLPNWIKRSEGKPLDIHIKKILKEAIELNYIKVPGG